MKIGILEEGKTPADKRVPFTPEQCRAIEQGFPGTKVYVQKSDVRCFSNDEYQKQGIAVVENVDDCVFKLNKLNPEYYVDRLEIVEKNYELAKNYLGFVQRIYNKMVKLSIFNKLD